MCSRWTCWLLVGVTVSLGGCEGTGRKHTYPDDPLFVTNKPVETPPAAATPAQIAYVVPPVPPVPPLVLAARQQAAPDYARKPPRAERDPVVQTGHER